MQAFGRWAAAAALGLAAFAGLAEAQSVLWSQGISGKPTFNAEPGSSEARYGGKSVAVNAAGDVFVAGLVDTEFSSDVLVVKYDGATGRPIWGRHYNGPGDGDDGGVALALDPSGNPVVVGYAATATAGNDLLALKYDGATGSLLWTFLHNGSANANDSAAAVAVDAVGDVFVAGDVSNTGTATDMALVKLNGSSGTVAWIQAVDRWTFDEITYGMTLDDSGNPITVGGTITLVDGFDALAVKFNGATGAAVWSAQTNMSGGAEYFFDAAIDAAGNLVAVGLGSGVAIAARIDPATGRFVWTTTHSQAGSEFYSVALDPAGDAIAAGIANGQFNVRKLALADGAMIWDYTFGEVAQWEKALKVIVDSAGHAYATGYLQKGSTATREDIHATKLDGPSGTALWSVTVDYGDAFRDIGRALALDPSGKVILAGEGYNGNDTDLVVMKLDPGSGTELWRSDEGFFVPAFANLGGEGRESALALDTAGNAYVVGSTRRAGNSDMFIAKLEAASGAIAWKSASRASIYGHAAHAVVATAGGPVALGTAFDYATGYDMLAVKYDATTGSEVWRHRFNSGGTMGDFGDAMAADSAGDVFIAGRGGASPSDVVVRKLDGATGGLLWSRQIDLAAGSTDTAHAIRVDAAGDAIVAGSFTTTGPSTVFALKIDGASGATIWTRLDVGPGLPTQSFGFGELTLDAAGHAVVGGTAFSANKAFVTKLDGTNGAILFAVTVATPDTEATSVRLDSGGRIGLVGNYAFGDIFAAKLDGVTGAPLWENAHANPGSDRGHALAFDASDNLIAVGGLSNGSNADLGAVAFDAASGAVAWTVPYAGTKNDSDVAYAAASEGTGNIVIAGDARESTFYVGEIHVVKVTGAAPPVATLSASSLAFGSQQVGTTSASQTVTLTNTGGSPLAITNIGSTGDFAYGGCPFPSSLPAGASCTFTITFTPIAAGARIGSLDITTNAAGSPHAVALSGSGVLAPLPGVGLSATSIDFGAQAVGTTSAPQRVTLTNTGKATLSISAIAVSGDFGQSGCPSPGSLAEGASCELAVTFTPAAGGSRTGSILITSDAPDSPHTVNLSGTGVLVSTERLQLTPELIDFGDQLVGSESGVLRLTLRNAGESTAGPFAFAAEPADFSARDGCPASLAPRQSCFVQVTFRPSASGVVTGSLTVSTASSTRISVLRGRGIIELPPQIAAPRILDFGPVVAGDTGRQALRLSNSGGGSLLVQSWSVLGEDFALAGECPALAAGASCTLEATFRPHALGTRTGRIDIRSNDPRGVLAIELAGESVPAPAPQLVVVPGSIGFGNQMMGTTSTEQDVELSNVGNARLVLTALRATGDFRVTSACPAGLEPGERCHAKVRFAATGSGIREGVLTVESNDSQSPHSISLKATGCRPYTIAGSRNVRLLCGF